MQFRKSGQRQLFLQERAENGSTKNFRLVHVTSVGAARQIFRDKQLTVRACPVFKRDLNYFFLLRPAYKLKNGEEKQSLVDFFPVVLVLKCDLLGNAFHVYPFDTGGAHNGSFDSASSPWLNLDDFELLPSLQAGADHIKWAFGTRKDYFEGNLDDSPFKDIPDWDSGPHAYRQIAKLAQFGHNQPDLRASSIEVAYDANVKLSKNVEIVVLPKAFIEDPRGNNEEMIRLLKELKIKWTTYDWQPNQRPSEFHDKIHDIVRLHLQTKKVI